MVDQIVKTPVRADGHAIVDADNKIVIPDITWRADVPHRDQQSKILNYLIKMINETGGSDIVEHFKGLISDENNEEKRGRGRPRKDGN